MLKKFIQIIVTCLLVFAMVIPDASAIYSPVLSEQLQQARAHIRTARRNVAAGQAGTSTREWIKNAWDWWSDKQKEASKEDKSYARILPADYQDALKTIKSFRIGGGITLVWDEGVDAMESLFGWLWGSNLSACVRDDIYEIEDLLEVLTAEMIRTGIMADRQNYQLLKNDFLLLQQSIYYLRKHPEDPPLGKEGKQYLFPDGSTNYYLNENCPANEWQKAWEDFGNSFDVFLQSIKNMGESGSWGSIAELSKLAESRAAKRAREYIKKNQITITLGGEKGGNPQSLIRKDEALGKEWGIYQDQLEAIVGPVLPYYEGFAETFSESPDCVIYRPEREVWQECTAEEKKDRDIGKCLICINPQEKLPIDEIVRRREAYNDLREVELSKLQRGITYQLQFANVLQQSDLDLDNALTGLNSQVERMYKETAGVSLPTLLKNFQYFEARHCANKAINP